LLKIPVQSLDNYIYLWVVERYGNSFNFILFLNYFTAFLKDTLLSVTILTRLSYLYIISLKSYCFIALEFSCLSTLVSIYENNSYFLYAIYLQLFDTGLIYTISTYKTWKSNSVYYNWQDFQSYFLFYLITDNISLYITLYFF